MRSFENTDPAFHTGIRIVTFHKSDFVFVFQAHLVRTGWILWLVEGVHMCLQSGFPLLFIAGVACQHPVVTDQTAFDSPALACDASVAQLKLVPVHYGMRLFAAPKDVGMLFEQADDLVLSRDLLLLQDVP